MTDRFPRPLRDEALPDYVFRVARMSEFADVDEARLMDHYVGGAWTRELEPLVEHASAEEYRQAVKETFAPLGLRLLAAVKGGGEFAAPTRFAFDHEGQREVLRALVELDAVVKRARIVESDVARARRDVTLQTVLAPGAKLSRGVRTTRARRRR